MKISPGLVSRHTGTYPQAIIYAGRPSLSNLFLITIQLNGIPRMETKIDSKDRGHDDVMPEKAELAVHEEDVHAKKLTRQILWKLDTRYAESHLLGTITLIKVKSSACVGPSVSLLVPR